MLNKSSIDEKERVKTSRSTKILLLKIVLNRRFLKIDPHLFLFHRAPQDMSDIIVPAQILTEPDLVINVLNDCIWKLDHDLDAHTQSFLFGHSPRFAPDFNAFLPSFLGLSSSVT